jgi:hypothetical protein
MRSVVSPLCYRSRTLNGLPSSRPADDRSRVEQRLRHGRDADGTTFVYKAREPGLGPRDRAELATVCEQFAAATELLTAATERR